MAETMPNNGDDDGGSISTILVVEDEILVRMPICDYLRDCGYRVIEAGSGEDAVRVIESGEPVDLIFSDVQMPGAVNGFELASWIRANRPDLAVILTSGVTQSAAQAKDLCKAGNPTFFPKPYAYADLERHIRTLVGKAAAQSP